MRREKEVGYKKIGRLCGRFEKKEAEKKREEFKKWGYIQERGRERLK